MKVHGPTWGTDLERGDIAVGRRIVEQHGRNLAWVEDIGWFIWDGQRWAREKKQEALWLAEQTVRGIYLEAYREPDEERREALSALARSHSKVDRQLGALKQVKPYVAVTVDDLDRDPFALNVANGTVDLRTGKKRPHDRRDYITKLIPIEYSPDATAPRFELFLQQIFDKKQDLIDYTGRSVGYSATGDQREQCLFFPIGLGENGKSTLMNIIGEALGEYSQMAPSEVVMQRKGEHVSTEKARLRGMRFVVVSESSETQHLDEEQVKQLTGDERKIVGRFLFHDNIEFPPTHHLWIPTNHKPIITGTDHAIWRRIKVLLFDVRFGDAEDAEHPKDKGLKDELKKELPGVLAWIVAHARLWWNDGNPDLGQPPIVTEAIEAYREESDILKDFIDEACVRERGTGETKTLMYLAYVEWAKLAGLRPWPKPRFGKRLKERGTKEDRGASARDWLDIKLKDEWLFRAQTMLDARKNQKKTEGQEQ